MEGGGVRVPAYATIRGAWATSRASADTTVSSHDATISLMRGCPGAAGDKVTCKSETSNGVNTMEVVRRKLRVTGFCNFCDGLDTLL
jgi:hypothetical protein